MIFQVVPNYGTPDVSVVGVPFGSTVELLPCSFEGVKLGFNKCELLGSTLVFDNRETLVTDERVYLRYCYSFLDGCNESVKEGSFFGYSLLLTDVFGI